MFTKYSRKYRPTTNEGSNLSHYITTNSVGYTKYSHTAPDNVNTVQGTSSKMTSCSNIRMAKREAGREMGDECNWVSSMSSGVEPFGITITKAILNNGTSNISATGSEYSAPHMIWGHDTQLVSSRSIYQHQLPYHLPLVSIVNIFKQAPCFPRHSRLSWCFITPRSLNCFKNIR